MMMMQIACWTAGNCGFRGRQHRKAWCEYTLNPDDCAPLGFGGITVPTKHGSSSKASQDRELRRDPRDRPLRPRHFLPTVIFISGILSAFFVNDIICLVMAPFVIAVTRRLGMKPVPHLLALATASNIGSAATIT